MSTQIFYNNIDAFANLAPTPFISRSNEPVRFGERWALKENIQLQGNITGKCSTFAQLIDKQNQLATHFGRDFQSFQVIESGRTILSYPNVKFAGLSFGESNYGFGAIPFTINLEVYPQQYFSGQYGVLEPKEDVQFNESEDGIVKIVHALSARGLVTNNTYDNALENAQNWVNSRTGYNSSLLPNFINYNNFNPCLFSVSEEVDRLNGVYTVTENYTTDILLSGVGVLRFTTEYDNDIDNGVSIVRVEGRIDGCKNGTIEDVRARYAAFNAFGEALLQFQKITNRNDLYPRPITKAVSEDTTNLKLSFSYVFSDDKLPEIYFEYKINFDFDYENDIITARIEGTIQSSTLVQDRWAGILNYASQINLYNLILPSYYQYVSQVAPYLSTFPLNPVPISTSRSENQYALRLTLGATYSNRSIAPNDFLSYDYQLNFSPAIHQYSPNPILDGNGSYIVFDLGYARRAACDLEVRAVGGDLNTQDQVVATLKNNVVALQNQYFSGTRKNLDSQRIALSTESFSKNVSIQASYSAQQGEFTLI